MLLENIPLGRTLEIYIDREGYRYRLVSKVEEAKSNQVCVSLSHPMEELFSFMRRMILCIVYREQTDVGMDKSEGRHCEVGRRAGAYISD